MAVAVCESRGGCGASVFRTLRVWPEGSTNGPCRLIRPCRGTSAWPNRKLGVGRRPTAFRIHFVTGLGDSLKVPRVRGSIGNRARVTGLQESAAGRTGGVIRLVTQGHRCGRSPRRRPPYGKPPPGNLRGASCFPLRALTEPLIVSLLHMSLRAWRNWQTRRIQVPVAVRSWRFDSSRPHFFRLVGYAPRAGRRCGLVTGASSSRRRPCMQPREPEAPVTSSFPPPRDGRFQLPPSTS